MNAVDVFTLAASSVGYADGAIVPNYTFEDILDPARPPRTVSLAAFTQTPRSYRSAAFAAVLAGDEDPQVFADKHRALGAPALFVIQGDHASLWKIQGSEPSKRQERLPVDAIPAMFEQHRDQWRPEAIHRAKSIGAIDPDCQLDFVDIGLLPAIEGEIHLNLHRLLCKTLESASHNTPGDDQEYLFARNLFSIIFRFLAAKVLLDRKHSQARDWSLSDPYSVLRGIESFYSLDPDPQSVNLPVSDSIAAAWECLQGGISFANIASDDLAYIYEETLITPDTRKQFGTHSTPRQLAEYAVARLQLHRRGWDELRSLRIYEPFAGVAPFLISAIRHIRDLLPSEWSDAARHKFLTERISGDEIDSFACEAAKLSLILADYPNRSGWRIDGNDLFEGDILAKRMAGKGIILCNPPFEDFDQSEREGYPISATSRSKPAAVLNAALTARPKSLAFVLPHSFIRDQKFLRQRKKIEEMYSEIEIVDLPQAIFSQSGVESALLIANAVRNCDRRLISLRSTEIAPRDRRAFLKRGQVTTVRCSEREAETPSGDLWIVPLESVWKYTSRFPTLGDYFEMHQGLRWASQRRAWSREKRPGYERGLHTSRGATQLLNSKPTVYLDTRPEKLQGNAIKRPWNKPKIIVNAGRLSTGGWRMAAMPDVAGLLLSQQFFGLWPSVALSDMELLAFSALLNGPVANAFIAAHNPAKGIRIYNLERIPVPFLDISRAGELVAEYVRFGKGASPSFRTDERREALLTEIDALVLGAYDLPPLAERELLDYFADSKRPVAHKWRHWDENYPMLGLTLAERLSGRFHPSGSWILDVFRPLQGEEAEVFHEYGAR